jgi:plasmid rolling circle replication initiator protein Rep
MNDNLIEYEKPDVSTLQPFIDKDKRGKPRPWNQKKRLNERVASVADHADLNKKAMKLRECASTLVFRQDADGGNRKLYQAYFCKDKFCPMCNWRRTLKLGAENMKVIEAANAENSLNWVFLTLTVKNCKGDKLKQTIDDMQKGFTALFRRKAVSGFVKGWFRCLEITVNRDQGTYHPHFHVLICASKNKRLIRQNDWVNLWRVSAKLDYQPVVNIKRVTARHTKKHLSEIIKERDNQAQAMNKAIAETSKYPIKSADILGGTMEENAEVLKVLDSATFNKRLIAYGGLLKKIRSRIIRNDDEDDLIHIDDSDDSIAGKATEIIIAKWHIGLNIYVSNRLV